MDFQQIIVILIGIGCLAWVGIRIYRTFNGIKDGNDPCAGCPTGCELHRQLREKRRHCEKVSPKAEKVAVDSWRYEKMYYLCNRKTKETRFTKTAKTYKVKVP